MNTETPTRRDQVIAAAIAEGKFSSEKADFWREEWAKNPVRAEHWIERSAAGVVNQPKREPTTDDLVRLLSGQRMVIGEPEPPDAARFVSDILGLRPVA